MPKMAQKDSTTYPVLTKLSQEGVTIRKLPTPG